MFLKDGTKQEILLRLWRVVWETMLCIGEFGIGHVLLGVGFETIDPEVREHRHMKHETRVQHVERT